MIGSDVWETALSLGLKSHHRVQAEVAADEKENCLNTQERRKKGRAVKKGKNYSLGMGFMQINRLYGTSLKKELVKNKR